MLLLKPRGTEMLGWLREQPQEVVAVRRGRDNSTPLLKVILTALVAVALGFGPTTSALAQSNVNGSNTSSGSDASSGDANGSNSLNAQAGPQQTGSGSPSNVQKGNNRTRVTQETTVQTGDATAGQVIGGVVSDGNLVINATNRSDNVDVTTGDANATNNATVITGPVSVDDTAAFVGDAFGDPNATPNQLSNAVGQNIQNGNNTSNVRQVANAQSGNGVGGQVIGAVVNGGTTDIAASNTTTNSDVTTGEADASNDLTSFVGLLAIGPADGKDGIVPNQAVDAGAANRQNGSNRVSTSQSAGAVTGQGIAGQVLGVVSAGDTRVDASNMTTDSTVDTGNSTADNSAESFVGLLALDTATDQLEIDGTNVQDGNNTSRLSQSANALTGDGVAGQIAGIVTRSGGSVGATLANTSARDVVTTGESNFDNSDNAFTGQLTSDGTTNLAPVFSLITT